MKEPEEELKPDEGGDYLGTVSKDGKIVEREIRVEAKDRRDAIRKILLVFWAEKLGNAREDLVVSDELEEVQYDPDMKCSDVMYNYLPRSVLKSIIEQSEGAIGINPNYPASGFQLVRLKKKNYKSDEWQLQKRKKKESTTVTSVKNWKPGKARPAGPKHNSAVAIQTNLWLSSTMAMTDTPRNPTVTIKAVIRPKNEGESVGINMPIHEMALRGGKVKV